MTTTANLSVGLDTSQAFESLKRLRQEMQNQPHKLLISVDPTSVDQDIQRYLKQRTFKISVNTRAMGDEIANDVGVALDKAFNRSERKLSWNVAALRGGMNAAVEAAFNDSGRRLRFDRNRLVDELEASVGGSMGMQHIVNINREALTESVRAAVATGLAGGVVHLGGAAGGPAVSGLGPDLTTTLQRTLLPAVDAMERAANAIASAARKAEIAPPNGKLSAKESISQKDPITGFTKSVSRRLDNPEAQLVDVQELARLKEFAKNEEDAAAAALKFTQAMDAQKLAEIAEREANQASADKLNAEGYRAAQFKARREAARAAAAQERADAREAAAAQAAQERLDALNLTGQRQIQYKVRQEAAKAAARQAVADARDAVELEKAQARLDMLNLTGERQLQFAARREAARLARAQELADAREAARTEAAQDKLDMLNLTGQRQLQYKARQDAARAARAQEAADAAEAAKAERLRLDSINNQARFSAAGQYNGTGQRIAGAAALSEAVGPDAARAHLGSSGFLVGEIANLEDYRLKTKAVSDEVARARDAHKALNEVFKESHSAVRGLAGSLGEMWVTWGSLVPLIVGAGIGKALKDTLVIGADVQGNLARVASMSGTAGVSLTAFNNAIVGSMEPSTEAAVGLKDLAQSGLGTADALRALPPVLALAKAGQLDLKDTTHDLVGVMNAFGMGVGDLTHIGDVIGKTASISNISTKEMLESMRAAGEVASEFKLDLSSTASVLGVLAEKGITGAGAANQLQKIMSTLAAPTGKAAAAMKELGINAVDSNKQVLPLLDALQVVRDKTQGLSEASRDLALKDMFSVRNTKALVAVMDSLDNIKEKMNAASDSADGFNRKINEAVGDTVQGKFKKLITSFEIDATEAFEKAGGSIGGFIDQIRIAIDSPEFKQGLSNLVSGVVSLTRAFTDNIGVISEVAAAYAAFKVLGSVITWFEGIPAVANLAKVAVVAFGVETASVLAYATAGISVVLGAAAAYLVLADHTTEAEKAARDYANASQLANDETSKRIERLAAENSILERQIELEYSGVAAIKARKQAEDEAKEGARKVSEVSLKSEQDRVAFLQAELTRIKSLPSAEERTRLGRPVREELDALRPRVEIDEATAAKDREEGRLNAELKTNNALAELTKHVLEYNEALKKAHEAKRALALQPLPDDLAKHGTISDNTAKVDAAMAALSKVGGTYTSPGHNTEAKDEVTALIEQLSQAMSLAKLKVELQKNIDDASFPIAKDSGVNAYLAEQRAIQATNADLALQLKAIKDLTDAKQHLALTPSQRDMVDRTIQSYTTKLSEDQLRKENQSQVSAINSANRQTTGDNTFNALRAKLSGEDEKQLAEIRQFYSKKVENPGDAAGASAALAAAAHYTQDIVLATEKVKDDQAVIATQRERAASMSGEDLTRQQGIINALEKSKATDESRLTILKAQQSSAAEIANALGKSQYDASQTAAAGWKAFWDAYTANATSAAKQVEDLLKTTTDSIEKAAEKFATTGKWSWRPIADSVLNTSAKNLVESGQNGLKKLISPTSVQDATKGVKGVQGDLANTKLTTSLTALDASVTTLTTTGVTPMQAAFATLSTAAGSAASALASVALQAASNTGTSTATSVAKIAATSDFANGGIMTPYGPMALRKYAGGGVAHGPQVSVHGEGTLPEANVPLADGRSIPVTLQGAGTGGNVTQLTFAPVIHIDSRSDQAQVAQMVGNAVKQGQKSMLQHLKDVGAIA